MHRRDFIVGAASTTAVLKLSGCGSSSSLTPTTEFGIPTGTWHVQSVVFHQLSAISDNEAETLSAITVKIFASRIEFGSSAWEPTFMNTALEPLDEYLDREYRTTRADLGVGGAVACVVTTDCEGTPFSEFVSLGDQLLLCWDGVFLILRRMKGGR